MAQVKVEIVDLMNQVVLSYELPFVPNFKSGEALNFHSWTKFQMHGKEESTTETTFRRFVIREIEHQFDFLLDKSTGYTIQVKATEIPVPEKSA